MLSGEYAVLDGAPAIVAAVGARAVAELAASEAHTPSVPPEVSATWRLARERFPALPVTPPSLDVRALRDPTGAQKLGLGSSAAAAAATAGLALARAGFALDAVATRSTLFELAFEGHRVIAPDGAIADLPAITFDYGRRELALTQPSVRRPESARPNVTWSVNSSSLPCGMPLAMRLTATPSAASTCATNRAAIVQIETGRSNRRCWYSQA
mgnify:CR=1 FL=1